MTVLIIVLAVTPGGAVDGKPAPIGQFKFAVKTLIAFDNDSTDFSPLVIGHDVAQVTNVILSCGHHISRSP